MPPTEAELMQTFLGLRKEAFQRLATPLRDAVLSRFERGTQNVKTAAEAASIDRALFLHSTVR